MLADAAGNSPNRFLITRASLAPIAVAQTEASVGAAAIVVLSHATKARYGIPPDFLFCPQLADSAGTETEQPVHVNGIVVRVK